MSVFGWRPSAWVKGRFLLGRAVAVLTMSVALLSISGSAFGAIGYVRSGGTNGTSFPFDIGTAGTDRLVVVIAADESTGINLTGVTVDGNACNPVTVADNPDSIGNHQEMWYCDEDDLGASNGSVTVAIAGGSASWGVHAHLYTGVIQSGPLDSGIDNTSVGGTTVTVPGIDVSANGLVVMGASEGTGGFTGSSYTSPLIERDNTPGASTTFLTSSGVESSAQTNKTYVTTFSGTINRGSAVVASWDEAPPAAADVTQIHYRWRNDDGGELVAISVEETVTGNTTSATFFTLTSWTPLANELVLVAVALRDETLTVSVSGNGLLSSAARFGSSPWAERLRLGRAWQERSTWWLWSGV